MDFNILWCCLLQTGVVVVAKGNVVIVHIVYVLNYILFYHNDSMGLLAILGM